MKYAGKFEGIKRDELIGGNAPISYKNYEVAEGAEVKRGMIMAANSVTGIYKEATASDGGKYLLIARDDFTADSETKVTTGMISGEFNREGLKAESAVIDALELPLRQQNIHLTSIKEMIK